MYFIQTFFLIMQPCQSMKISKFRTVSETRIKINMDCRETGHDKVTGQTYFFRVCCTSFHIHSPLLTFFLCFIVLFQSFCSHAQVFERTLVHVLSIFYSHSEWNMLSCFTITVKTFWTWSAIKLNSKKKIQLVSRAISWNVDI